jgi:hypothetical protein
MYRERLDGNGTNFLVSPPSLEHHQQTLTWLPLCFRAKFPPRGRRVNSQSQVSLNAAPVQALYLSIRS